MEDQPTRQLWWDGADYKFVHLIKIGKEIKNDERLKLWCKNDFVLEETKKKIKIIG